MVHMKERKVHCECMVKFHGGIFQVIESFMVQEGLEESSKRRYKIKVRNIVRE